VDLIDHQVTEPLPPITLPAEPPTAPAVSRLRAARRLLCRTGKVTGRILLNWGVLIAAVAAVLVVRHHIQAQARVPLPAPTIQLSAADTRQWQAFPSYRGTVPVLLYHGVSSRGGGLSISPEVFAEQMLALRTAGFHTITLAQYVRFVDGDRGGLPAKPILLTFDGGRLMTYRTVNDILRKYGFNATMFTFASWPTTTPGYSLTWGELRAMQRSGTWSVAEAGGQGRGYVVYDAAGDRGSAYAFRQYTGGSRGHLEGFPAFLRSATSDILWGEHQFAAQLPGFRPLAFAVPGGNYGQLQTNDPRIPRFMVPWLTQHFQVAFLGDYLDRSPDSTYRIRSRFSKTLSYGISMGSRLSLPALNCRLRDWVTRAPIFEEYRCLRAGSGGAAVATGPGRSPQQMSPEAGARLARSSRHPGHRRRGRVPTGRAGARGGP
jgi:Polysaccharide deacetylase